VQARFSPPLQTGLRSNPDPYALGTGPFPGVKRPGRDVNHLPLSEAEVKERVELAVLLLCAYHGMFYGEIPDGVIGIFQ